jgi:hypothetical protein
MESLTKSLANCKIRKTYKITRSSITTRQNTACIKIQKYFRGYLVRSRRLPMIMYLIQKHLAESDFECANELDDGRINSCIDEEKIIKLLETKFGSARILKPKHRMWFDILMHDRYCGWIPINIKTTTTLTSDNTGNLAMCVHAYTDEKLNLQRKQTYGNGEMSKVLIKKLKDKKYNSSCKKDYYFVVVNKSNPSDIIINSVKGLSHLTPNANNLPFQICWDKNREFIYKPIKQRITQFLKCLKKPKPSWKETFMTEVRALDV